MIVGESTSKIDRTGWGVPLRLLSLIADVSAIYFTGVALKAW